MKRILALFFTTFIILAIGITHIGETVKPKTAHVWTVEDSKAYAKDVVHEWGMNQFRCLEKMWTKESNWRSNAYNKVKVMNRNAGGIPQLLGLSPQTPPTEQIDRGFSYIMYRYGTPCMAWKFHQKNGWY